MSTYRTRIVTTLQGLCDSLTAAGVPASQDRARMQIPGAWVTPASIGHWTLDGAGVITAAVLLVVPAAGDVESLEALAGLLDKTLAVLTPDEDVDTSVVLNVRNNSHPAFRLAVLIDLDKE